MHSDAPNWWIKHTVWTFKRTNNTQTCWINQINIQIQHMNETDSQKCSFEQKNVIIKHLKLSTVPKMLNRKFKNIKWRFSCIYNAQKMLNRTLKYSNCRLKCIIIPQNPDSNIWNYKFNIQMTHDSPKCKTKHKVQIQWTWGPKNTDLSIWTSKSNT